MLMSVEVHRLQDTLSAQPVRCVNYLFELFTGRKIFCPGIFFCRKKRATFSIAPKILYVAKIYQTWNFPIASCISPARFAKL